jgi:hypothetical protein
MTQRLVVYYLQKERAADARAMTIAGVLENVEHVHTVALDASCPWKDARGVLRSVSWAA